MIDRQDKTILVAGVTGRQGGAVARRLLADGWSVRGMSRQPDGARARAMQALGVEVVGADMTDRESLEPALRGAYGVFAMATPFEKGEPDEATQGRNLGDAAAAARVGHYVYSSVGGADRRTGIPHFESKAEIEAHLASLGLPLTIIRPVYFMENFVFFAMERAGVLGYRISMPLAPDRPLQSVAVDDIAGVAAAAFADPLAWIGDDLELAGDERTLPGYAAALSGRIRVPVDYVQVPFETVRARSEDQYLMYRWFQEAGYAADIPWLRTRYPGLRDFQTWLDEGHADGLASDRAAA
jgi:uncharacterized protein YbjT (DUF2867 family)